MVMAFSDFHHFMIPFFFFVEENHSMIPKLYT